MYPAPKHDKIIEPFAGSAAYSLCGNNWEKEVELYDTYPVVIGVWNYLKKASAKDIESLPAIGPGDSLIDHTYLSDEERHLIGFCINPGSSVPKLKATGFTRWQTAKKYILTNLHKIKHWKINHADYSTAPDVKATWFIDPPYQKSGKYYVKTKLDYEILSQWVGSRKGQLIVCENEGADWLNFEPLTTTKNTGYKRSREVLWKSE
jgi:hypothetical protein